MKERRKRDPLFYPGVLVVVVTEQGSAIKPRAEKVRRIPESERKDADLILGTLWSPGSDNSFDIQVGRNPLRWCLVSQAKL